MKSPFARAEVLDDPVLEDVAAKRDASIPQVTLAWLRDLDEEDHDRIDELDRGHREVDFAGAPWDG